jgi:hypothetical protein
MSSVQIQETRKAENMAAAVEAIKETGLPTPRTDEALPEPFLADEHKLIALVGDMAEGFVRLHTAYNHTAGQIDPSQDSEIKRLQKRVEQLEKGSSKGAAKK